MYSRIIQIIFSLSILSITIGSIADPTYAQPLSKTLHNNQQAANTQAATQLVINEVHYNPADNTQKIEFIELYNPTSASVDLSDWILTKAVEYTFPSGTQIDAGQYKIVAQDPTAMQNVYGLATLGPWAGKLSGDGEKIELRDASATLIDKVNYDIDFPWPVAAGGDGASMELIHPDLDNDLGSSWRSAPNNGPTPGQQNGSYATNAPPNIRQVDHLPKQPAANAPVTITAKVTDPEGVSSVELEYQVVLPGQYIPAYLAKSTANLIADPNGARSANPAYNSAANWTTVTMNDSGSGADAVAADSIYSASLPAQSNRTLVRYRITVTDAQGAAARVPYSDDPSLNFAYFVYNGVPAYIASTQSTAGAAPYTHSAAAMNAMPVYTLLTTKSNFDQAVAYNTADQIPRDEYDARSAFNWSGTFVYNGKVYDNMAYRLRQRNARYKPSDGKRSLRFRFNRGNYAQFHDLEGNPYPTKWRTLDTHKMWGRTGTYGINELMNSRIWTLFGVPAPSTHWTHLRVINGTDEAPSGTNGQFEGDFYGLLLAIQSYDARFLEAHDLEKGNLYKLKSSVHDGKSVQRYQAADSVSDASDFDNILWDLRPEQSDSWLNTHVDYPHWYRYHAVIEAVRHYDFYPNTEEHIKNRAWYFKPSPNTPLGIMQSLPWDSDASWGPNWNGGGDFVKQAMFGYDGASPRSAFLKEYRNTVRELRDLIWQEDQIHTQLDYLAAKLNVIGQADRDRWADIPGAEESYDSGTVASVIQDMKNFAFVGGSWIGGNSSYMISQASDSGLSGQQGRDAYLDWLAADNNIPNRPSLSFTGGAGYPIDQLSFQSNAFSDPQGSGTFAAMQWRLAEITDPSAPAYDPAAAPLWEYDAIWESGELTSFNNSITIPGSYAVPGHTYRARVRMKDSSGRWSHWSAAHEFTASAPINVGSLDNLVISEIHYNPAGSDESEFLEFRNNDSQPLYLSGVTISGAVDFRFDIGTVLPAGGYIIVVEDRDVFETFYMNTASEWYYPNLTIAGKWSGKLNNAGEEIIVSSPDGSTLMRFAFSNSGSWSSWADDQGSSLELTTDSAVPLAQPAKNAFLADGSNWYASSEYHGAPGRDGLGFVAQLGDVSCDGVVNVIDALLIMQYDVQIRSASGTCPLEDYATRLNTSIGDVNADQLIDVVDALLIMQCVVQIANAFCP